MASCTGVRSYIVIVSGPTHLVICEVMFVVNLDVLFDIIVLKIIPIIVCEFVRFFLFHSHCLSGRRGNWRRRMIWTLWFFWLLNFGTETWFFFLTLLLKHLACNFNAALMVWFLGGSLSRWILVFVSASTKEIVWWASVLVAFVSKVITARVLLNTAWLRRSRLLLLLYCLLLNRSSWGRSITLQEIFEQLHHNWLILSVIASQTGSSSKILLAHSCAIIQIGLRQVNLKRVVKAVKLKEFTNKFGAYHTRSCLHDFACIGIFPVEGGLSFLDLLLIINDFEDTGSELGSQLAQDTVGLECLNY